MLRFPQILVLLLGLSYSSEAFSFPLLGRARYTTTIPLSPNTEACDLMRMNIAEYLKCLGMQIPDSFTSVIQKPDAAAATTEAPKLPPKAGPITNGGR